MKTIFDIGSNNGDDIPYYLMKADKVVAFEANPILCEAISKRFEKEINDERLILERGVLCADKDVNGQKAPFYINKTEDFLSQFPVPDARVAHLFEMVELPVLAVSEIIGKYGTPYYVKLDIENYDHVILSELFRLNCFPTYISAEYQSDSVLSALLSCSAYQGFKLVDGSSVDEEYSNKQIETIEGVIAKYSFPAHSAGPFGEDIHGPWYDRDSLKTRMFYEEFGWKDLHASTCDVGRPIELKVSTKDRINYVKKSVRPYVPTIIKKYYATLRR
jgi:FkbM family methyltransferase